MPVISDLIDTPILHVAADANVTINYFISVSVSVLFTNLTNLIKLDLFISKFKLI